MFFTSQSLLWVMEDVFYLFAGGSKQEKKPLDVALKWRRALACDWRELFCVFLYLYFNVFELARKENWDLNVQTSVHYCTRRMNVNVFLHFAPLSFTKEMGERERSNSNLLREKSHFPFSPSKRGESCYLPFCNVD